MTVLPIILMHNYCSLARSLFCFLHHYELWTTKQALTATPKGLIQGLGGVCMAVGGGEVGSFLQDNWHSLLGSQMIHSTWQLGTARQPGSPVAAPAWLAGMLLPMFSHGQTPLQPESAEKGLCAPWMFSFFHFQ